MNETLAHLRQRELHAAHELNAKGWLPLGGFKFWRNGRTYDLSAADLNQLDRIEAQGLFLVA